MARRDVASSLAAVRAELKANDDAIRGEMVALSELRRERAELAAASGALAERLRADAAAVARARGEAADLEAALAALAAAAGAREAEEAEEQARARAGSPTAGDSRGAGAHARAPPGRPRA